MPSHYKFCPRCGSPDVEWELPHTWSRWLCGNCGYLGSLILENEEMAVEVRKAWLEDKKGKEAGKEADREGDKD